MGFWLASSTREVATLLPGRRCTSEETAKKTARTHLVKSRKERASVVVERGGEAQTETPDSSEDRRKAGREGR